MEGEDDVGDGERAHCRNHEGVEAEVGYYVYIDGPVVAGAGVGDGDAEDRHHDHHHEGVDEGPLPEGV